jgi:hypothetical protein
MITVKITGQGVEKIEVRADSAGEQDADFGIVSLIRPDLNRVDKKIRKNLAQAHKQAEESQRIEQIKTDDTN